MLIGFTVLDLIITIFLMGTKNNSWFNSPGAVFLL